MEREILYRHTPFSTVMKVQAVFYFMPQRAANWFQQCPRHGGSLEWAIGNLLQICLGTWKSSGVPVPIEIEPQLKFCSHLSEPCARFWKSRRMLRHLLSFVIAVAETHVTVAPGVFSNDELPNPTLGWPLNQNLPGCGPRTWIVLDYPWVETHLIKFSFQMWSGHKNGENMIKSFF